MEREVQEELGRILPYLHKWAFRYSTPQYGFEELVTDTIIDLLEHPEKYDPSRGPLKNFLFSAIKNRAWDFRRSNERIYKKRFRRVIKTEAKRSFEDVLRTEREWPEKDKEIVRKQLLQSSNLMSKAFRMYAIDGKSHAEIATALNTTSGNVKAMIHRIRKKVRGMLSA